MIVFVREVKERECVCVCGWVGESVSETKTVQKCVSKMVKKEGA